MLNASAADTNLTTVSVCDDCGETVTLPFTFMWLGYYPVTQVYVTSNGFINILKNNSINTDTSSDATPISSDDMSVPSGIVVTHENLDPSQGGGSIATRYVAYEGIFIISYQNVAFNTSTNETGRIYAQAVLYPEGTIDIRWGKFSHQKLF